MLERLFAPGALPFSFAYGGRPFSGIPESWHPAESAEPAEGGSVLVLRAIEPETKLLLEARARSFYDSPAQEWVLSLTNTGAGDTPVISGLLPLDITLPIDNERRVIVHGSRGSLCRIDDFVPVDDELEPGRAIGYAPQGGRSSNGVMPFMNVRITGRPGPQAHGGFRPPAPASSGFVLAVGWSGQWKTRFERSATSLRVTAGMEHVSLRLRPGESIRTPRILIVPWAGEDEFTGPNLLRRLILAHYTPRDPQGQPQLPPIAHMRQLVYYFTSTVTEEDHLLAVERAHELGIEAFWVDALWYGGGSSGGVDWATQVGSWSIRRDRFPRGLKPIADAAHARGMKFVLWFEPERVFAGTEIAREHPEWLLGRSGDGKTFLLDLGNPAARRHILELVSAMIREVGIDIYRQDFNMDPLAYWRSADEPGREGMHEIRHIEGLYALWDELRSRHPGLAIDNCSSGGRRIDLETTARSYPLWRSDYTDAGANRVGYDMQIGAQCQVAGLSRWVPLHDAAVWTFAPYDFRSAMSTGVIPYTDIRAPDYPVEDVKAALRELKRLRPFWLGDFRTLVPLTASPHDWAAYQCHRGDLGAGFAVFLRRQLSPFPGMDAALTGLDGAATYEVRMSPTYTPGPPLRMSGAELARLRVDIPLRPGSLLLEYRKLSGADRAL